MKEIQSQLIKPFIEKMEKDWQALYNEVRQSKVAEAVELRPLAEKHIQLLRQFLTRDEILTVPDSQVDQHDFVRQSKADLRSAERRWKRHLVSTARVQTRIKNYSAQAAKQESAKKSERQ